jgi:hypothetical protein
VLISEDGISTKLLLDSDPVSRNDSHNMIETFLRTLSKRAGPLQGNSFFRLRDVEFVDDVDLSTIALICNTILFPRAQNSRSLQPKETGYCTAPSTDFRTEELVILFLSIPSLNMLRVPCHQSCIIFTLTIYFPTMHPMLNNDE